MIFAIFQLFFTRRFIVCGCAKEMFPYIAFPYKAFV